MHKYFQLVNTKESAFGEEEDDQRTQYQRKYKDMH